DTGQFSIAGGYSDTAGAMGNVTIGDRNFFGRGESVKLSLDYGQYTKGFDLAYSEPYLFGQRVTLGLDAFAKQNDSNSNQSYTSTVYGGKISVGTPLTDQLGLQWRYSLTNQSLVLDPSLGTASIPVQEAAAAGPMWVSAVGSTISYNTLDDDQHPSRTDRLHHPLGRSEPAVAERLLRRTATRPWVRSERFRAARHHAGHDH